jgi:UrcA family protein
MTKNRIALFGSAIAALLCAAGVAKAQDYDSSYDRSYYDYDARPAPATETVIVHPYYDYDRVDKRQLVGRINGEVNPTEYSLSRPVVFSDLDLSREADYIELRARVRDTARDLCFELDARVPDLRGDSSADRECVRTATRNAMRDVMDRIG